MRWAGLPRRPDLPFIGGDDHAVASALEVGVGDLAAIVDDGGRLAGRNIDDLPWLRIDEALPSIDASYSDLQRHHQFLKKVGARPNISRPHEVIESV